MFLRRACWEAAIIAYGRCFIDGQGAVGRKRTTVHSFVGGLSPALRAAHDQVLALRDKRIGHHVASESGQAIALSLDVGKVEPGVLLLNGVYVSVESELYDSPLLGQLEELTQSLRERVGARIDALRSELHAKALADPGGHRPTGSPIRARAVHTRRRRRHGSRQLFYAPAGQWLVRV